MSRNIIIGLSVVLALCIISLLVFFFKPLLPCDYENFAWGHEKTTCTCLGIKVMPAHKGIAYDMGESTMCRGFILKKSGNQVQGAD